MSKSIDDKTILTGRVVFPLGDVAGVQERKAGSQERDRDPERQRFSARSVLLVQLQVFPQDVGSLGRLGFSGLSG